MRWLFALATLCALTVHDVQASDIKVVTQQSGTNPAIIIVTGPFYMADGDRFGMATSEIQKAVVFFDSTGGNALAATTMGWHIRKKGFQTAVANHGYCASACALAWLGGTSRFLGKGARIGFHSAAMDGARSDYTNALVGDYLTRLLGYSSQTVYYITKAEPQSMTWLTEQDAKEYGIDFRRLPTAGSRP
jgi:hypothetical protein